MVTESKLSIRNLDPEAQLLGNMEKLCGDLMYHHLRSCAKEVIHLSMHVMCYQHDITATILDI